MSLNMSTTEKEEFMYIWNIKHFQRLSGHWHTVSPSFEIEYLKGIKWQIRLDKLYTTVCCHIMSRSKTPERISIDYQFELTTSAGVILETSDVLSDTFWSNKSSDWYSIFKKEDRNMPEEVCLRCRIITCKTPSMTSISSSVVGLENKTDILTNKNSFKWSLDFSGCNEWTAVEKATVQNIPIDVKFEYIEDALNIELLPKVSDNKFHTLQFRVDLMDENFRLVTLEQRLFEFNNAIGVYKSPRFLREEQLRKANCFITEKLNIEGIFKYRYNSEIFLILSNKFDSISDCNKESQAHVVEKGLTFKETSVNENVNMNTTCLAIDTAEENSSSSTAASSLLYTSASSPVHGNQNAYVLADAKITVLSLLQQHLKIMLNDKTYSDVELRADDGVFFAHKCFLASWSPVFRTMFDQDMLESKTNIVHIHDVEAKTLKYFLEYIYTGTLNDLNKEIALKLLLIADKYQVSSLSERCSDFLKSVLSLDNVLNVLLVADLVNQEQLKFYSVEYIVENSTQVLSMPIWPQWMKENPALASKILLRLSKKFDSISTCNKEAQADTVEKGDTYKETSAKKNINMDDIRLAVATTAKGNSSLSTAASSLRSGSVAPPVHGNQNANVLADVKTTVEKPDSSLHNGNQKSVALGDALPENKSETIDFISTTSSPKTDFKEDKQVEGEIGKCPPWEGK